MTPKYFIGTSGWHYDHWRGLFYPKKIARKDWLNYYAQHFNTVEINMSFYRMPQESTLLNWKQTVPTKFCFALKASRLITHIKRLKEVEEPQNTFSKRASFLENNLGPILYQLPAVFKRDDERLETFLNMLDKHQKHVFEFRHVSWMDNTIFNLLRKYECGFCIFDKPGYVSPVIATTDYGYIRFHGKNELYGGNYPEGELSDWANILKTLSSSLKTLYIYFNNDAGAYATANAITLRRFMAGL